MKLNTKNPFSKMLLASAITGVLMFIFLCLWIYRNVNSYAVNIDIMILVVLLIYLLSSSIFIYLILSPRIKRTKASPEQIDQVSEIVNKYPEINNRLNNVDFDALTYGDVKSINNMMHRLEIKNEYFDIKRKMLLLLTKADE